MARAVALIVLYFLCENAIVTCNTDHDSIVTARDNDPSHKFDFYCVVPERDALCPSQCESRCNILQHYYSNASSYFKSNIVILFTNGIFHHTSNLTVERVVNLSFTSLSQTTSAIIQCSEHVGFIFNSFSQITIKNMNFLNCGQLVYTHNHQRFHAALGFINGSHLALYRIVISHSPVQGLLIYGVQGNISIKESRFSRAGMGHDQLDSNMDIAGNSIFAEPTPLLWKDMNIVIKNSEFVDNSNRPTCVEANISSSDLDELCDCRHLASGLALILRHSNVSVQVFNSVFKNNSGCLGGNLAVVFNTTRPFHGSVLIQDCLITNGIAVFGGGLYIFYFSAPDSNHHCSLENDSVINLTTIANTTIEENIAVTGGGLYTGLTQSLVICIPYRILITNSCRFQYNTLSRIGFGGVAIHSMNFLSFGYKNQILLQFLLVIQESEFTGNYFSQCSKWNNSGSGVIYIKTNRHAEMENISIYNNQYSGIMIVDSNLVLSGSIEIYNNSGSSGGGMLFCSNSIMFLTPNTTVTIANNQVEHAGGGICVEGQCMQSRPLCFFQPDYKAAVHPKLNHSIKVILKNNNAKYAGDQIYGGTIDYCYLMNSPYHNVSQHIGDSVEVFQQLFQYDSSNSHSVTSPQRRVCLCYKADNSTTMQHNCSAHQSIPESFYPGEPFTLSAVVVGQLDGPVPGTVYAELKTTGTLGHSESIQKTRQRSCTDLQYTIYTNHYYNATLVLNIQFFGDKSFTEHLKFYKPLEITIAIKECPLGFNLHAYGNFCHCLEKLQDGFHCNISNKTIIPKRGFWIGYSGPSQLNQTILYSVGCTIDYCRNTHLDYIEGSAGVTSEQTLFSDQDSQCQFNRTGILCGSCSTNSSVILGSSQCSDDCANTSLLLIPLFAVMGILLVILLVVLNMTVTEGTVNGLLFYANIVQISNVVLFRGTSIPFLSSLFKGFIAWLNLDFGISTCLYRGMDDYAKAWLQFAFPLYIWLITGVIIYLSRHFTFVARMVNKNGVSVLATLILISYSKMVRATIVAVHFKILYHLDPNGSTNTSTLCWYSDCNVQYMKGKHILLGIVGFILVLCLLPFAFFLLFSDHLNKLKCCSLWKLKPFLDAYTGPYTDEGRYWTGLLLVVRIILFAASGFSHSNGITSLNVTLSNVVVVLLLILPWLLRTGIYHKRWLNILECSFLMNLGVLSTGTQYLFYYKQRQEWLTHMSIGLAFTTFFIILIYHLCQLKGINKIYNKVNQCHIWHLKQRTNSEIYRDSPQSDSDEDLLNQFPPLFRFDQDREPLLSYTD